jgi:multicomponent Na+:H+ antiporter subunit E
MAFLLNLLLALVWCMLTGDANPWNFLGGLFVGAMVISIYSSVSGRGPYLRRGWWLIRFGLYFTKELVVANIRVAKDVLTPGFRHEPRIIRLEVSHLSLLEKTTLANAITLTPGTLTVDISPDGRFLYLHCMYASDPEAQRASLNEMADRLRSLVFMGRPEGATGGSA